MKTSKKILIICLSIAIILGLSFMISSGITIIFPNISLFVATLGVASIIWLCNYFFTFYRDTVVIKRQLEKISNLPYKQYTIDTTCQHCGHKEPHNIDLSNLEYKCGSCKKYNAIYVTFTTAAMSSTDVTFDGI